ICPLSNPVERISREFFHFEQLFPMSEITVAVPVIHDAVRKIFRNSWKLSQLFDGRGVDIKGGDHIADLDVTGMGEVLQTLSAEIIRSEFLQRAGQTHLPSRNQTCSPNNHAHASNGPRVR